jgi:hypothetical protein
MFLYYYGSSQNITRELNRVALLFQRWVNSFIQVVHYIRHLCFKNWIRWHLFVKNWTIIGIDFRVNTVGVSH